MTYNTRPATSKSILALGMSICLFASCTTTTRSVTSRTQGVYGENVMYVPVLADLSVGSSRVTATVNLSKVSLQTAKAFAVSEALKQANADVLVDPVFASEVTHDLFMHRTVVTVTGYPAHYRDFRSMTAADSSLIKHWPQTISLKAANEQEGTTEKGKKWGAFILPAILVAGLLAFLL